MDPPSKDPPPPAYSETPNQAPYGAPPVQQQGYQQAPQGFTQAQMPPQQQYGQGFAPAAQPYQQPPMGYGAPPQQPGYGAPPQQAYGAPPQQTGYGAPPQQGQSLPPVGYYQQQPRLAPNQCVKCTTPYPLPPGASSWRCKHCGHFNDLQPSCCVIQ